MARWRVRQHLWIGAFPAQEETLDVVCVVNLAGGTCFPRPYLEYVVWPIDDGPVLPDAKHLRIVAGHVADLVVCGLPVLVHCGAGINRSGLVVARALMILRNDAECGAARAIEELRLARGPEVLSNGAFRDWLKSEEGVA
jgi:protein-tyrosine phosphatase